jgi:hypothetical protein
MPPARRRPFLHQDTPSLLSPVELLVQKMQEKVDVKPQIALEEGHELMSLKLRLQEILDRHKSACARNLNVAAAALEGEDADLVARDSEVNLAPIALRHA